MKSPNQESRNERSHRLAIDSAPGKALINRIRDVADPDLIKTFFRDRLEWCGGYPLVHDRFVTYGAFDDLRELDSEARLRLVPALTELTTTVPDEEFHAALALLADMIPDDAIRPRPAGFSCALLQLRLRSEKLAFLPNLTCAWDALARKQRYLKEDGDPLAGYSPAQLSLDGSTAWRRHFSFPLMNFSKPLFKDIPIRWDLLRQRIQSKGALPGQRKLIYATRIENSSYLVWRIPGKPNTAHLWKMIFLRCDKCGECGLGEWDIYSQFSERDTPEAISKRLLEIEFYPRRLEKLDA